MSSSSRSVGRPGRGGADAARAGTRGPTQRQLRVGELLRHALVEILQREDLRDPALSGVAVTVSEVRPSPDLKQATAFCARLGGGVDAASSAAEDEMVAALNRAAPMIRRLLGRRIDMKYTPAIVFRRDESFDEAQRIASLLARPDVARDLPDE